MLISAYILHCEAPGKGRKKLSHLDFHFDAALGLINGYSSRKRQSLVDVADPVIKKPKEHELTKIQTAGGHRDGVIYARGTACAPAGNKIQSSWECANCQVALCKERGCFGKFHDFEQ